MLPAITFAAAAALFVSGNHSVTASIAAPAPAVSDPVAVYAIVDAIALLPNAQQPTRIRIDGAISVFGGRHGSFYESPRWGSLYFAITEGKEDKCRKQWADLAAVAGKRQVVGFGSRYECRETGLSLQARDAKKPTWRPFPVAMGVRKIERAAYGPILWLKALPRPVGPQGEVSFSSDYRRMPFKQLTLTVENCASAQAGDHYLFEVQRASGERYGSPLIPAGDGKTQWQVWVQAKANEKVTWSARLVRKGLDRAPVTTAAFVAKVPPQRQGDR